MYFEPMEQTGFDPINPTKVAVKQVDTSPDGKAIVSAVGTAISAINSLFLFKDKLLQRINLFVSRFLAEDTHFTL